MISRMMSMQNGEQSDEHVEYEERKFCQLDCQSSNYLCATINDAIYQLLDLTTRLMT